VSQLFWIIFQSPSLHGTVFVGTLSEAIPIRPIAATDEASASFPQQTVQEIWEKRFRELSDENPELTVSGIILFYPTYVLSYCEVVDVSELRKTIPIMKTKN
jgi:hypothetical protein